MGQTLAKISVKPNFELLNYLKVGATIKCHACDQQLVYKAKECRAQINLTLFKAHNSTFDVYNACQVPHVYMYVSRVQCSSVGHYSVAKLSGAENPRISTYIYVRSQNSKENHGGCWWYYYLPIT